MFFFCSGSFGRSTDVYKKNKYEIDFIYIHHCYHALKLGSKMIYVSLKCLKFSHKETFTSRNVFLKLHVVLVVIMINELISLKYRFSCHYYKEKVRVLLHSITGIPDMRENIK